MSADASVRILPDPAQIDAADPRQSVFVTANAGSGKTSTLVDRVARLLLAKVSAAEILCVTYTKAAAAEMQGRLYQRLGAWAVADDDTLRQSLADLDGRDPNRLSPQHLRDARKLFAQALDTPGGLKIQTLHAFCEKLLRRFPLEAGVTPGFKVLEDQAAVALSRAAREDLARKALEDPDGPVGRAYAHFAVALAFADFEALLSMLEQERARLTDYVARVADGRSEGPHKLAGADPERDVETIEAEFIRFLDRDAWLGVAEQMATGSTTDQACADQMWKADWTFADVSSVFLTGSGQPRKSMATKSAPPFAKAWLTTMQDRVLATLGEVRKARLAEDTEHVLTLAQAHAHLYEQRKAARGALDFGDLVARTVDLLTRRTSAAWVLYKLDGGIEHVLIDEAQDTAPEQWAIVDALTEGFFSGIGSRRFGAGTVDRTVFAVGDAKQSIYSFQGAKPEKLVEKRRDYENRVTGAGFRFAGVPLETSFRSTPEVLSFVDAVFFDAQAPGAPERARALVGEQGDITPHKAMRANDQGCVDLWPLYQDDKRPDLDAWEPVDAEAADSARKRMAKALAEEIKRQVETGVAVQNKKDGKLRSAGYGDFLILVRRRDATFEEIIRALKSAGVPVAGADRLKLSTHIAFDDLKSIARFALYPDDDLSLAEVLRSPFCDVDEDGLFDLAGANKDRRRLWRELRERSAERPEWTRARALLDFALDARGRDPFAFFSGLLNRVDDIGLSGRARVLARLGREAEEALDETLNQVLAAGDRGGLDLETALAMLEQAEVEVKRELEGPRGEVRVMTVHGAKGLEAPIVILPDTTSKAKGMGPALMPVALDDGGEGWLMCLGKKEEDAPAAAAARAARDQRALEESLRLLYVALTRARDRVIVMGRGLSNKTDGFEDGSWWSVLTETFDRLSHQVRDIGDDRRRFGHDPEVLGQSTDTLAAPATVVPDWARRAPPVDPSARYVSPSQAKGPVRAAAPSPLAVVSGGEGAPLGRFRRGDLIHLLLERLPEITPDARPDAARRLLARERGLSDDQRDEMITAAFGVLDDLRFAPVFGPGSRAEVALVGSAPELAPGVSINGRIDRLVITPERILVVDYKTNRPAPDRIEDADPAYVTQIAVYVAVLRALYLDRPVEAALVWTDGPKLMAVPEGMMGEALAGLG